MKTVEELYKEISASEELQKTVSEIRDNAVLAVFLKEHDCEASVDDFVRFAKSQSEGEIEDESAEAATGGYRLDLDPESRRPGPRELP